MISAKYDLSLSDCIEGSKAKLRARWSSPFFYIIGTGLLLAVALWIFQAYKAYSHDGLYTYITNNRNWSDLAIFFGVTYLIGLPYIGGYSAYSSSNLAGKELRYDLAEDGISWRNPISSGHFPWASVVKLVQRRNAIAIFVDKHASILLPRRAFQDDSGFKAACQLVQDMIARNKDLSHATTT